MAKIKHKKQVIGVIKLQIQAGKATPAPPIGPALGQHGVNIMDFCKAYNDQTKDKMGLVIPVEIFVYADRTFVFDLKTPPVSEMIKKVLNIKSGSATPNTVFVGKITMEQVEAIAKDKMEDLNAHTLDMACNIILGSARSMGVTVKK